MNMLDMSSPHNRANVDRNRNFLRVISGRILNIEILSRIIIYFWVQTDEQILTQNNSLEEQRHGLAHH